MDRQAILDCCKKGKLPWVRKEETADTNARIRALALHLEVDPEEIELAEYSENVFQIGKGKCPSSYLVVTDDEANQLWDEYLESYIDECILPEIPECYQPYFDSDKWIDAARTDGRAHSLNRYDGAEGFGIDPWENQEFYIYRQD